MEAATGGGSGIPAILIAGLTAITLGALIVTVLVLWGRKQERLGDMMLFCLK